MTKAITKDNKIIVGVPKQWERPSNLGFITFQYNLLPDSIHFEDGWLEVVNEPLGQYQRYGNVQEVIENGNVVGYVRPAVDFTENEIINAKRSESQANQEQILLEKSKQAQLEAFKAITDDAEAIENIDAFGFWDDYEDEFFFEINYKVKDFVGSDIQLFRVEQGHEKRPDRLTNNEALFTRIPFPGEILPWEQPSGAQDAYDISERVTHDNPNNNGNIWIYESKIPANTTEPGRDGTFDRWWEPIELYNN